MKNEDQNLKVMCTVYDDKGDYHFTPMVHRTKGDALRTFQSLANNTQTQIGTNPEDFTLFEIGEYDERTGQVFPHKAKISLGKAIDYVRKTQ